MSGRTLSTTLKLPARSCRLLGVVKYPASPTPPVEGRASVALCEFLADSLSLPHRAVTVRHGELSRQKGLRIEGLELAEVRRRLGG